MLYKKFSSFFLLIYGAILLFGGFLGHVRASRVSLITGTLSAMIVIISALAAYKNKPWGIFIGFAASFALFAFFLYRYSLTFKFMPAGLMSVLSLSTLCFLIKDCKNINTLRRTDR
jgi:uncharacterized membrane protein (UPF0136 family)